MVYNRSISNREPSTHGAIAHDDLCCVQRGSLDGLLGAFASVTDKTQSRCNSTHRSRSIDLPASPPTIPTGRQQLVRVALGGSSSLQSPHHQ
jgi:hypothetical protein